MNAEQTLTQKQHPSDNTLSRPVLPGVIYRIPVSVNGKAAALDGFYEYYPNNIRISVSQLSDLFEEAGKPFTVSTGPTKERVHLTVNGKRVNYPLTVKESGDGKTELFLAPADIAMMLDCGISSDGDCISYRPAEPFSPDMKALEKDGFFQNLNSLTAVDLTEDKVYYEKDADRHYPIASISKLMTVLIVLEEIASGTIRLTDTAEVSANADVLSVGEDAMVRLYEETKIPISELLYATLVCSSNECALVLAEKIAGSEEAFVKRMREKAAELGMSFAEFVNCHGLPFYTKGWAPGKVQNRVSANDLLILTKTLLEKHPVILTFTSAKEAYLPTLERAVSSTNPLLRNLEEVNGFKTGSTNKAGNCLITTVRKNGKYGAVVLLGAESSEECFRKSEITVRYLLNKM